MRVRAMKSPCAERRVKQRALYTNWPAKEACGNDEFLTARDASSTPIGFTMAAEGTALLASISFALFAVFGWLGLRHSTPIAGTIISLAARTVTLGAAVIVTG